MIINQKRCLEFAQNCEYLLKLKFFLLFNLCFFSFSKLVQIGTLFLICVVWIHTTPRQKRDLNGVCLNSHRKVRTRIALIMTSNPEKALLIYDVAELSSQAFLRSFSIENSTFSFKSSGIHSYNPDVFPDDVFLPFLVTDKPSALQRHDNDELSNGQSSSGLYAISMSTAAPNKLENEALLTRISPYPKADAGQKQA